MIRQKINKLLWLIVHKPPWLKILIWGPSVLMVLLVAFYQIENYRGQRALNQALARAEAQGISLKISDYLPQQTLNTIDPSTIPGFDHREVAGFQKLARLLRRTGLHNDKDSFFQRNRWQAKGPDIRLWLDPSIRPKTEDEAEKQLRKIAHQELEWLHEIRNALNEKRLIFSCTENDILNLDAVANGNLNRHSIAELARDEIRLDLQTGNHQRILANLSLLQNLTSVEEFPTLVGSLISVSVTTIQLQSVEEILWSGKTSKKILLQIQDTIPWPPRRESMSHDMSGELVYSLTALDRCEKNRPELMNFGASLENFGIPFLSLDTGYTPLDKSSHFLSSIFNHIFPRGWFDLAKRDVITNYLTPITQDKIDWKELSEIEVTNSFQRSFPKSDAATMFLEISYKAFSRFALVETQTHLLQIAILLELHNLQHGTYPATLAELNHELPFDFYSGQPFRYQRKPDGTPHLWSIGPNQIDDGGLPNSDRKDGDLVWMLTPIPGLTESNWRKKLRTTRLKN